MTPESIEQQIPALGAFIQQKLDGLMQNYQAALAVAEGPNGYLTGNVDAVATLAQQINTEQSALRTLAAYQLCIANWKLNDAQYAELNLPRPPFPQVPQALVDEIVQLAAMPPEKDAILAKVKDAAGKIGINSDQTNSLVAILSNTL